MYWRFDELKIVNQEILSCALAYIKNVLLPPLPGEAGHAIFGALFGRYFEDIAG